MSTANVDVSSRASVEALVATATGVGEISGLIHAAGASPTRASPATILKVDLYGTALVLEQFGGPVPGRGRNVGALLMGPDGGFITGSEVLMDGGVTAAYWYGALAPN